MFIRNRTPYSVKLSRSHVSDSMAVAAVVVEGVYSIQADGRLLPAGERKMQTSDPPSPSKHPIWAEVSLTVSGSVAGPARAPHMRRVELRVGDRRLALHVYGDRRWKKTLAGGLEAGEPERFERIFLGFDKAFGGSFEQAPGPDPRTGLPHPGGKVFYPLNPDGIGLYESEQAAENNLLPNVEWADQPIRAWSDRPEPAGFSPCPALAGLRIPEEVQQVLAQLPIDPSNTEPLNPLKLLPMHLLMALRAQHHAHGKLVFRESLVAPGTPVELLGMGDVPIQFKIPDIPADVYAAEHSEADIGDCDALRPSLRSLHIDADGRHVLACYGYLARYRPGFGPEWFLVMPRKGEEVSP